MRLHHLPTALLILLVVASMAAAQASSGQAPPKTKAQKFPIFVRAAGAAGGFSDPSKDRQDSVKDLTAKIKDDCKQVVLVADEKDTLLLVDVQGRETSRSVGFWGGQNKSRVYVQLTAGDFSTEFSADGGSSGAFTGYKKAAGNIAKQIDKWVEANREKLTALLEEKNKDK